MARAYRCNHCDREIETKYLRIGDNPTCPYCDKETIVQDIIEADNPKTGIKITSNRQIGVKNNVADSTLNREFNTLLVYGTAISLVGWIIVAFAVILLLFSFNMRDLKVIGVVAAIPSAAFGIVIVAFGQLISCFVSIERNTKETFKAIKQLSVKQ